MIYKGRQPYSSQAAVSRLMCRSLDKKRPFRGGYLELLENPSKLMFTNHPFDGRIVISVVKLVG